MRFQAGPHLYASMPPSRGTEEMIALMYGPGGVPIFNSYVDRSTPVPAAGKTLGSQKIYGKDGGTSRRRDCHSADTPLSL